MESGSSGYPAPHGRRFLAFIIDVLIVGMVDLSLFFGLGVDSRLIGGALGVFIIYCVLFWGFVGATPGKWMLELRLVDSDGKVPGLGRAIARIVIMALLSPFWITWWRVLFREDRRALHDLVAGTSLVHGFESARLPTSTPVNDPMKAALENERVIKDTRTD